jgi:hypothetical protein
MAKGMRGLLGVHLLAACALFTMAAIAATTTGCVYARMVYFNFPTLAAPRNFDDRVVPASTSPLPLARAGGDPLLEQIPPGRRGFKSFDDFLERNGTRAFVAIRDDRIVYERYFGGIRADTLRPDFSVSKTLAALLVGCAVSDGLIEGVDRRAAEYVPELRGRDGYDRITIDELLRMTPGIDFSEASPAGAVLYYTTDVRKLLYSYAMRWPPGTRYVYGSLSTEILWDVLRRRLAGKTVSEYFAERVWRGGGGGCCARRAAGGRAAPRGPRRGRSTAHRAVPRSCSGGSTRPRVTTRASACFTCTKGRSEAGPSSPANGCAGRSSPTPWPARSTRPMAG